MNRQTRRQTHEFEFEGLIVWYTRDCGVYGQTLVARDEKQTELRLKKNRRS